MNVLKVVLFGALLGGCTVMVNGKPRRIGGSDPAPAVAPVAQSNAAPAAQAAPPAQGAPAAKAPPVVVAPGRLIAVEPTLGTDPVVLVADTAFDTSWSKMFGHRSNSPDCGSSITSQPIASFEVRANDKDLHVSVVGGHNDGFIVRKGDLYWTSCTHTSGSVPTMAPNETGWEPGRYDIYPIARYNDQGKPKRFSVELYKPNAQVAWQDKAQRLVISGKLDRPMFVEVSTKAGRRMLRDYHSGYGCAKIALPATPDIALTIERPIPGLTIRPLPGDVPVTLRRESFATETKRASKNCLTKERGYSSSSSGKPSYTAPSEVSFSKDDEGLYAISLGSTIPQETKLTLMIFDDSTKFDELMVRPFGGEKPPLEARWIGYQMPQLAVGNVGAIDRYADAERAARVFAAVPKQALVYSKLDLDKDIASGPGESFPVKNEPLVVVGLERARATVLTADGLRFSVKTSHLLLEPDGAAALPTSPRALRDMNIGKTIAMLPPAAKRLGEAHHKKVKAFEACRDRAWAPYGRQLPTYSRPAGVDIVVYKSARTNQIEAAGERAMNSKCGTHEAFAKASDSTRKKLQVVVDKGRAKLLAEATAHLR